MQSSKGDGGVGVRLASRQPVGGYPPGRSQKNAGAANVETGSVISSDELGSYKKLAEMGYIHGACNHSAEQYVVGIYHVNGVEGFWSHLKRGIVSTHASVSPQHLQKYVDELPIVTTTARSLRRCSADYSHKSAELLLANTNDGIIKQATEILSMIRVALRL